MKGLKLILLFVMTSLAIAFGFFLTIPKSFSQTSDTTDRGHGKTSGSWSKKKNSNDDDDDKYDTPEMQRKLAKEAKIRKKRARKIALKRIPGKVVESEIDKEDGRLVWEFEIKKKDKNRFEVLVDAKTGDVVEVLDESGEDDDRAGSVNQFFRKAATGLKSGLTTALRKIT